MRPPVAAAQQAIYGSSPSGPPQRGVLALPDLMAAASAANPLPIPHACSLAKACFPGWRTWRRPRIIDPPFLLRGVRETIIGNTLLLRVAPKTFRRVFYVVLEASGRNASGASGAAPKRTGKGPEFFGNFVKSSGLKKSMKGPNAGEMEPQLC